jgi:hypothetical protein
MLSGGKVIRPSLTARVGTLAALLFCAQGLASTLTVIVKTSLQTVVGSVSGVGDRVWTVISLRIVIVKGAVVIARLLSRYCSTNAITTIVSQCTKQTVK